MICNARCVFIEKNAEDGTVTGAGVHAPGDSVALSAVPDAGWSFIGWRVLSGNVTITNGQFTMPDGNVAIQAVFLHGSGTPDFTQPKGLRSIRANAFAGIGAQAVEIPDGCAAIGSQAFKNCLSLKQIRIPASVQTIGENVFAGCGTVYVYGEAGSKADQYCQDYDNCVFVAE